jgi:hypothetical protein
LNTGRKERSGSVSDIDDYPTDHSNGIAPRAPTAGNICDYRPKITRSPLAHKCENFIIFWDFTRQYSKDQVCAGVSRLADRCGQTLNARKAITLEAKTRGNGHELG